MELRRSVPPLRFETLVQLLDSERRVPKLPSGAG
jgi:hypothetical protein